MLLLNRQYRLGRLIPIHPLRILQRAHHQFRRVLISLNKRLLYVLVNGRLRRRHEAGTHVHTLRAKSEARR